MSGSPKYSATELERRRQQELEEKRRQEAAAEAQRRKEAAERERQRQLEQGRNQLQQQLQSFQQQLTAAQTLLHPGDFKTLSQDSQTCLQQISHAADQQALKQLTRQANQFPQRLETAKVQKRRDDAEKQRLAELDQQRFELGELEQQQQQLDAAIVQKFDPTGAQQVQQALDKVRQAIGTGKPQQVKAPLKQATQALQTHQQTVATALAQWQQAQSTAQDQLQELQTLLAGLQADPIIQRWQTPAQTQIQN
ncbi:MAG: hypothetical protein ACO3NK_17375, partial [Prochlorotrichaceae cyanobacterium]